MAVPFSLILLLVAVTTATTLRLISTTETHSPSQPPSLPITPPPPPPLSAAPPPPAALAEIQANHLNNIIDALIGAGDFAGWANLLSTTDPSTLPLTATFFIPGNDAVFNLTPNINPFLIPYHIVPQRLTFSDLQQFMTRTRLPTLLPGKYIVVTDNSLANFAVDGSKITQADIFVNSAFSVHGIEKLLDYSVYGGGSLPSPPDGNNEPPPEFTPSKRNPVFPPGEITFGMKSSASCPYGLILMIFAICGVVAVILFCEILRDAVVWILFMEILRICIDLFVYFISTM
ncbi:hypothetical protein DH2020_017701 [Rehmannia glutinosa]|uniref:FAS1 domain-containing protein n=1 Tax=Rehmannia glutinosa TaxID=99300 RepID=A0ABR0WT95_REHGL